VSFSGLHCGSKTQSGADELLPIHRGSPAEQQLNHPRERSSTSKMTKKRPARRRMVHQRPRAAGPFRLTMVEPVRHHAAIAALAAAAAELIVGA
jgi:hypothetical protein